MKNKNLLSIFVKVIKVAALLLAVKLIGSIYPNIMFFVFIILGFYFFKTIFKIAETKDVGSLGIFTFFIGVTSSISFLKYINVIKVPFDGFVIVSGSTIGIFIFCLYKIFKK